ncbi:MAG TPA: DUF1801 domain-containing protein [Thermoplasmata archaeon]|nr:DUF1801 domain-containing protein [Thermoplasmata archaeon]
MVQSRAATVDEYLAGLPTDRRAVIARLRGLVQRELKGFQEGMEFGMPYYRGPNGAGIGFASQVGYIALYTGDRGTALAKRNKLDAGKSCIRFRQIDTIPWGVVVEILQTCRP